MEPEFPKTDRSLLVGLLARALPRFYQLLYHHFAWTYDLVAWIVSLGQWNIWVKSVIPYLHSSPVLEIGHGPGHLQVALKQEGIRCIGLELSKQMIGLARRRLKKHHLTINLINARAQHIPLSTETIPQVVATFPSEYVLDPQTLLELYRVLTPGGSVIILLFAWITGQKVLERFAAWLFRITGESPGWRDTWLNPARAAGFIAHGELVARPGSTLLIVKLIKPL